MQERLCCDNKYVRTLCGFSETEIGIHPRHGLMQAGQARLSQSLPRLTRRPQLQPAPWGRISVQGFAFSHSQGREHTCGRDTWLYPSRLAETPPSSLVLLVGTSHGPDARGLGNLEQHVDIPWVLTGMAYPQFLNTVFLLHVLEGEKKADHDLGTCHGPQAAPGSALEGEVVNTKLNIRLKIYFIEV